MGLRPSKAEVYFSYICPKCQSVFLKTFKEVKYVGKDICYCGYVLEFEYMENVVVTPQYKIIRPIKTNQVASTPVATKQAKPAQHITVNLINGLVQLGYKKASATGIVSSFINSKRYNANDTDDQNFIKMVQGLKTNV